MLLYHGSNHIIPTPDFSFGKKYNDFGKGFYCTEEIEIAKEQACKYNTDGLVNTYSLNLENLKVLNFYNYTILNWIASLLKNRIFNTDNELSYNAKKYILDNFDVDIKDYDVIIGYNADNSCFAFVQYFIDNSLSLRDLCKVLKAGGFNQQVAIVSEKALKQLKFIENVPVDAEIYYHNFVLKDLKLREFSRNALEFDLDDIYVSDILREEMKENDPRLQRIICE